MRGILVFIIGSMLFVALEWVFSYRSGGFYPSQVMQRWGRPGIASFAHGGIWGDFLLLPFLMAWIIYRHGGSWSPKMMLIMGAIGLAITLANHILLITTQEIPDPLGWQQDKWSVPIALHFVYMTLYVALVGLFYFYSPSVTVREVVFVSVVLGIHTAFGTHVVLGMVNLWEKWPWCPDFLASPVLPWLQLGIWAVLAALSWVAAGWEAGVSVAGIAIALAAVTVTVIRSAS